MKSKTKYVVDNNCIDKIFVKAGLGRVEKAIPLEDGEFNSAYFVEAEKLEYVLKIAPKSQNSLLTYEKNLMAQEVAFYKIIAENSSVKIPKVYHYDNSKEIIPSEYFIMEKLQSAPLTECRLNSNERELVSQKIGELIAELHSIKGEKFGYIQNILYDNWYEAIKAMVGAIISDCNRLNKKCKAGKKLLGYIEIYRDILLGVQSSYVHFDLWDGNIFYENNGGVQLTIIDTERGLWGDSIGDFVSVEMLADLQNKKAVIAYNKLASAQLTFSIEETIRFDIMRAYLGLIIYAEKFFRYTKLQSKYYINIVLSKMLINRSLKSLKKAKVNNYCKS